MNRISNLERTVMDRLAALGFIHGVDYVYQARIEGVPGDVDFLFPAKVPATFEDDGRPLRGMVLEVDGCFYHGCFACGHLDLFGSRKTDERKAARLAAAGYYVVRLWGHEVLHDPERVGLVLIFLTSQTWGSLELVLDELDRAEEAAMERTFLKRLDRWLKGFEAQCAREGKPVPRKARVFYRAQKAAWLRRNPQALPP